VNIKEVLRSLASGKIEVVMKTESPPSPMAFGLATLGAAAGERRGRMREMWGQLESLYLMQTEFDI
jgi:MYXO-CTERM domain-containing protein